MRPIIIVALVLIVFLVLSVGVVKNLIYTCAPNEVLIFAGRARRGANGRIYGYRLIKGRTSYRMPLLEKVERMDLNNMVIDVQAVNAYSKGGIPLTVQGVANVKIAGHEPLLNNAIERFLGKTRPEIMAVAKSTLEGALRGVLATMTPQQVNEDKILFAERLVNEVEQDMTNLGLVVDTMKIQNVQDEVKYLESIGRKRNAEVVSNARVAEAMARADSIVRAAENQQQEVEAQINAQIEVAKADAQKRLIDAQTRRGALVAEEQAQVFAAIAQIKAELEVQKARVEQMRGKLDADIIQPAKAASDAAEANARAATAQILEEGKARAEALRTIAKTWGESGPNAKEILLVQKLESVINALIATIPETNVEKVTMVDSRSGGLNPAKMIGLNEQLKQLFGIDLVEKVRGLGVDGKTASAPPDAPVQPALEGPAQVPTVPAATSVVEQMVAEPPKLNPKKPNFQA